MTSRSVAAPGVTRNAPIVDPLPHFVGQVQPVQLRRHRALREPEADTYASLAVKREIAVIRNVLECGL
jgi:hypothetical protein